MVDNPNENNGLNILSVQMFKQDSNLSEDKKQTPNRGEVTKKESKHVFIVESHESNSTSMDLSGRHEMSVDDPKIATVEAK